MAERTVDDPTLLWRQWVDVVDASIVGQIVANAILNIDVLVVVAAIFPIDDLSIFVVNVFVVAVDVFLIHSLLSILPRQWLL